MPPAHLRAALAAALRRAAAASPAGAAPIASAPAPLQSAHAQLSACAAAPATTPHLLPWLSLSSQQRRGAAAVAGRAPRAPHDSASSAAAAANHSNNNGGDDRAARWRLLGERGHPINPCNSPLHPAVSEAGILPDPHQPELCLQEAYTPESTCWGCGPSAKEGLFLRSKRVENGLEARVRLDSKYESFPGIVNGGIVGTLVDCLSNWTAATHLMDTSAL
jgi:hypothetical protein